MIDKILVNRRTDMEFWRREAKPFASFDLKKSEPVNNAKKAKKGK